MENKELTGFLGCFHTLGDIVLMSTIARHIKMKYPNMNLTICTSSAYTDIFHNNPDIKEIIGAGSVGEVVLRSVEKKYDKVYLPLQLTPEHNMWHQTAQYCVPKEGEFHNLVDYYADRCMDDIKITDRRCFLYPDEKHWNEIVENIPEAHREHFLNTPYITLHTTSRNVSKDWPYNNFAELGKRIKDKYGDKLEVYQIGGKEDKPLPAPVFPFMGTPILNTAALLGKALLAIDGDSGPSHLASAMGTKTLCIMGATTSTNGSHGALGADFIEPNRHCLDRLHTPCATQCRIAPQCIDSVSVDEVFQKACELIDQKLGV